MPHLEGVITRSLYSRLSLKRSTDICIQYTWEAGRGEVGNIDREEQSGYWTREGVTSTNQKITGDGISGVGVNRSRPTEESPVSEVQRGEGMWKEIYSTPGL